MEETTLREALETLLRACLHPDWSYWMAVGDARAAAPISRAAYALWGKEVWGFEPTQPEVES